MIFLQLTFMFYMRNFAQLFLKGCTNHFAQLFLKVVLAQPFSKVE